MMFTFLCFFALAKFGFSAVDYTVTCGIPECQQYFDGCNTCHCNVDSSNTMSCTEMACPEPVGIPRCQKCVKDAYWLRYSTFQAPGIITCDSRFLKSAIIQENNSKCGCPASHPFYERGIGCIKKSDCPSKPGQTVTNPSNVFEFPDPINNGCPYNYGVCQSNEDCQKYDQFGNVALKCKIPKNNYKTCVPLFCNLDKKCELIQDENCSQDCMGTGWGHCVLDKKPKCKKTGCSSQLCSYRDIATTCEFKCKYSCIQKYQKCKRKDDGCRFVTKRKYQLLYKQCREECKGAKEKKPLDIDREP